jgi:hypothetical protein
MVDQPPKTVTPTAFGTQGQTATPPPDDLDKDQAKDGTRLDLWTALQNKKRVKSTELTDAEKKLLAGLTVADRANGWQSVYVPGQTDAQIHISPDNHVYVDTKAAVGSDEQIDAMLKGAVVAKSVRGDIGTDPQAPDEKTRLIMCKCAELSGLRVNHPPAQSLDQTDPALAKAVEARWRLMNGQPQATEKLDHTSTAGLVTTPSSLDTPPPVDRHFAAAVTPPVAAAAVTPAPAVAPKQALT